MAVLNTYDHHRPTPNTRLRPGAQPLEAMESVALSFRTGEGRRSVGRPIR
jgi:hypothetical protein